MYAKELTKEYLQKLGITEITKDGKHIYFGEKEAKQFMIASGYLAFSARDKEIYNISYPITKNKRSGEFTIPVQRAVYAWYHGSTVENMVIDHINDNKTDNRIENLQVLTPKENIWKNRKCDVREIKCMLKKPRRFYEEKLEKYLRLHELAKKEKDADRAHKLRVNISHTKARLRFWDSHQNLKLK